MCLSPFLANRTLAIILRILIIIGIVIISAWTIVGIIELIIIGGYLLYTLFFLLFCLTMLVFLVLGFIGAGYHPVTKKNALVYMILFYVAVMASVGLFLLVGVSSLGLRKSCTAAITLERKQYTRLVYYSLDNTRNPVEKLKDSKNGLTVIGAFSIVASAYMLVLAIFATIHMSFSFFRQVCMI